MEEDEKEQTLLNNASRDIASQSPEEDREGGSGRAQNQAATDSISLASSTGSSTGTVSGIRRPAFIIPTVKLADGLKEIPRKFEQCEIEQLVLLICMYCIHRLARPHLLRELKCVCKSQRLCSRG